METLIKKWYKEKYNTDDLGEDINPKATFKGLLETLNTNNDVYIYLEAGDSLIRERVFEKLAKIMKVSYNDIYNNWLNETKTLT